MEYIEHHLSLEDEDARAQPGGPRAWTGYHRRKAKESVHQPLDRMVPQKIMESLASRNEIALYK